MHGQAFGFPFLVAYEAGESKIGVTAGKQRDWPTRQGSPMWTLEPRLSPQSYQIKVLSFAMSGDCLPRKVAGTMATAEV